MTKLKCTVHCRHQGHHLQRKRRKIQDRRHDATSKTCSDFASHRRGRRERVLRRIARHRHPRRPPRPRLRATTLLPRAAAQQRLVAGSLITEEDLAGFSVDWKTKPIRSHLAQLDLDLVTHTAPSGGPVLHMIMQLIDSKSLPMAL